jgi:lipopolysaccharide transport system permease protein
MIEALLRELRSVWHARELVAVLVRREVAARHAGTALGVVWPYVQPLITVAAYYLVFDIVFSMRLAEGAPIRAVGTFLIVGALTWMAFCDAVSRGMNSLLEAGSLLQKNSLPPVLFVTRSVLGSALVYGPLLLLIVLVYTPLHRFGLPVLAVPALLVLQLVIVWLLAYLLAILAAALRDVVQVVGFLLSVGIYLSPILFPLSMFPAGWQWVLWINPVTSIVIGLQSILLQGVWPPLEVWGIASLWLAVLAIVLNLVVARSRDQLVDWL